MSSKPSEPDVIAQLHGAAVAIPVVDEESDSVVFEVDHPRDRFCVRVDIGDDVISFSLWDRESGESLATNDVVLSVFPSDNGEALQEQLAERISEMLQYPIDDV